ncbi:histidine kinase [Trueperella pyogenes]|uniref:sensor histidine kinase n=1 Tax=Trueperella pyogenes TaxID=1661 RepID=UPI00216881BD|nr:histidine kinase [Trueperella pyogenes]UVJ56700.1 histidine kinase [Trueperella pyogenes]
MQIGRDRKRILSTSSKMKSEDIFRLAFWILLVFISIIDLFFLGGAASSINAVCVVLLLAIAVLIPWRPRLYGWIFLLVETAFLALPSVSVGILAYVCVAVFFLWGWHRYKTDAALGTLVLLGGFWPGVSFQLPAAVMLLILLGTAFVLGHTMYRSAQERDAAVAQLWRVKLRRLEATQQFKANVAMQLHDSLAGTLSVVTKLAEAVRQEVPDNTSLSLKVGLLEEQARASLRELREIIQFLDSPNPPADQEVSLISALARVESIASTVGINLELEYEDRELKQLSLEIKIILFAFLREVATNLLKYAAPSTDAVLSVSCSTDTIEMMMKNQYHDAVRDADISSGRGLNNLRKKFELAGGGLDVWAIDNWWYVHGEVPLEKGNVSDLQQFL